MASTERDGKAKITFRRLRASKSPREPQSFQALFTIWEPKIRKQASRFARRWKVPELEEDLVQEALMAFNAALGKYRPERSTLNHYLWTVIKRSFRRFFCSQMEIPEKGFVRWKQGEDSAGVDQRLKWRSLEALEEIGVDVPEPVVGEEDEKRRLVLENLEAGPGWSPLQKMTVVERLKGRTFEEIAREAGVHKQQVRSQQQEVVKRLKRRLN